MASRVTENEISGSKSTARNYSLFFSDSVDSGAGRGTGHQSYQIREPAVTYWPWVNRWEPLAMGGDPPSLPPDGDLEIWIMQPLLGQ